MSKEDRELTKAQIADYRKTDELILKGDLYRLLNPFTDDWFAEMAVAKDKSNAYLVCMRLRTEPVWHPRLLKLSGLDENKTYFAEELNLTASGKTLLHHGVLLPHLPEYASWTLHLTEVK